MNDDLIRREDVRDALIKLFWQIERPVDVYEITKALLDVKAVDAVPMAVHNQIRWERDQAMQQLKNHGIPFGGVAPDVVKIVRCKDCIHWSVDCGMDETVCLKIYSDGAASEFAWQERNPDDFCSYGERRKDDG